MQCLCIHAPADYQPPTRQRLLTPFCTLLMRTPCSFSNIRARIPFEDLPYPGPLVALCQDIAIARASGLLAAEERLYWKLIGECMKGGWEVGVGFRRAAEGSQAQPGWQACRAQHWA